MDNPLPMWKISKAIHFDTTAAGWQLLIQVLRILLRPITAAETIASPAVPPTMSHMIGESRGEEPLDGLFG